MITQLNIHHLRNLNQLNLQLAPCNIFYGANGSGKTSILEALFLLSRGKSFRHHQPKHYISHHQERVVVHANFEDGSSIAIQKQQDASTLLRLSQQTVYTQSTLTQRLPSLLIDPSTMELLETGSASRRQLIDWMAFHVKRDFHPQWLAYQRLLKQRNALLKRYGSIELMSAVVRQELAAWDNSLANHAALITQYRQQVFNAWLPQFYALIAQLLPHYANNIRLRFLAGYDTDYSLEMLLQQRLSQDCQMGYTRIGCHRADIQVLWQDTGSPPSDIEHPANNTSSPTHSSGMIKEQAVNVLSRGEKKLLISALRLSQLPVLNQHNQQLFADTKEMMPVVLLDDITAELDATAVSILLDTLSTIPCQLFITSLTADIQQLIAHYWQDYFLFHVKQGQAIVQTP